MLATHTAAPGFVGGAGRATGESGTLRVVHVLLHPGSGAKAWVKAGVEHVLLSLSDEDEAAAVRLMRHAFKIVPYFFTSQRRTGWTEMPLTLVCAADPPTLHAIGGASSGAAPFLLGSGSAPLLLPPPPPLQIAGSVIPTAFPPWGGASALVDLVERGGVYNIDGSSVDVLPLCKWTDAAKRAAWAGLDDSKRTANANYFGDSLRVCSYFSFAHRFTHARYRLTLALNQARKPPSGRHLFATAAHSSKGSRLRQRWLLTSPPSWQAR